MEGKLCLVPLFYLCDNTVFEGDVLGFVVFQLPEDFSVTFAETEGELTIGGVYIRLFIQQPAWVRGITIEIKEL